MARNRCTSFVARNRCTLFVAKLNVLCEHYIVVTPAQVDINMLQMSSEKACSVMETIKTETNINWHKASFVFMITGSFTEIQRRGPSLQPDKSNSRSTEQSPNDVEGASYTAAVNYSEVEVTEIVSNKDKDEQHIAFKIVANPHNQREMISTAGVMKTHVCLEESVEQQGVDVIKGSNEPTRE